MRLVAAPHPFKIDTVDHLVPDGLTLAEMLDTVQCDPILAAHAHVWIGDQYIPRDAWRLVRPKPGATVTMRVVPHGGGGGKNPLRTVLTIAVIAAAFYFGGALGTAVVNGVTGSSLVGGSIAIAGVAVPVSAIGGAIITVTGTLLINVIAPIRPPSVSALGGISSSQRDSPTLFIEGARNAARAFGTVPTVLGVTKTVPPLGASLYTEIVGDNQFLRMLVVWGYGPLKVENVKIGETPIEDFDDVEIITLEGRVTDDELTLIPDTVDQDDFSVLLIEDDGWTTRSAPTNADELSVDITFPSGLVTFNDQGARLATTVTFEIQYREIGASPATWLTPTFTAKTVDDLWVVGDVITIQGSRTAAIRHGFRWSVATRGDYEIRVRRTTVDHASTQVFDTLVWSAIRAITNENPINFAAPVATTQLVIKATDQLNRVVDELNATVSSYVDSYDGGSPAWNEAISNNPADLFRHILQGPANARPLDDSRIDLPSLQSWHAFCETNGFAFNMVRDFTSSVWDALADVAAAGRASPGQVDGKWTVVVDDEQTIPVQHFTPRNSWGFEAEKGFPDPPHGFRIRFQNEEQGYRQDERIVYDDGYTSANATEFEGLDAPGITNPDQIWKFGRFQIAQARLRPERWTFNVDFEYLVARRGDLILITHDVLLVGLASGWITAVQTGGSPSMITGVTVDEVLTMDGTTNYGMSIRNPDDVQVTSQVVTNIGDQTTIVFSTPLALTTVEVGDLFGFGPFGSETIEGLLLSIEPASELSARVIAIPASRSVYDADKGAIPAFDTKLTPQALIPAAQITNVRSDESVLTLGAGNTLVPHIAVEVVPFNDPDASLDVQIKVTGVTSESFIDANVVSNTGGEWTIGNVAQGEYYDIRVRWRDPDRLPGGWSYVYNHRVVGQSSAPSALVNANISVFGGSALIRWDRPPELDVRFGGEVRFRHSVETDPTSALWQSSTSIGSAARGDALFATLPLKPGTYLARVFDKSGRPSDFVALATKQASVLTFANVSTITESTTFTGTKDNCTVDTGTLILSGTGNFDDIASLDAVADLDQYGGLETMGTYDFASGLDLTTVSRVRITSNVDATSINTLDDMDDRFNNVDLWEDWDGTIQGAGDVRVQVRHTDDNPAGSPVAWSEWNYLDSAEFFARGFEFRALLSTIDPAYNIRVDALGVTAEDI